MEQTCTTAAQDQSVAFLLEVHDYDLAATLDSGQSFAWTPVADSWEGVVHGRWVRLRQVPQGIEAVTTGPATTPTPAALLRATGPDPNGRPPSPTLPVVGSGSTTALPSDRSWLEDYLQTELDFPAIQASFHRDAPLLEAARCCGGLRILRQDPWECLASFLLSATKQIAQIRQICATLCRRFGLPVPVPEGQPPAFTFPSAHALAGASELDLRRCGMGFRARYLSTAAQRVAAGHLDLPALRRIPLDEARARLLDLPGVGPKIADCVLLFSCDQARAFPIDVWVARALRTFYFSGRRVPLPQLRDFVATHFGPWAGHAQQFLFHYARRHVRLAD